MAFPQLPGYKPMYKPRPIPGQVVQGQMPTNEADMQKYVQQLIKQYAQEGGGEAVTSGASSGAASGAGGAGGGYAASQLGGEAAASQVGGMSTGTGGGMSMAGSSGTVPAAPATPGAGALPMAGGALALGLYLNNLYEGGAKEIATGKGKTKDYMNTAVNSNPIFAAPNRIAKELTGKDFGSFFGGGKGKDQQGRDANRSVLKNMKVYDDKYNYELLDGSKVNMGLDGSKGQYNVDFNEKGIGDLVSYVDPIAELIAGGDAKRRSDLAGEFTNMIKKSKDPRAEAQNLYKKAGFSTPDGFIKELGNIKGLESDRAAAYKNSIGQLFNGGLGAKPANNPNSPGFRDGKRVNYSGRA